jgi:Amt family ammonium transporter
MQPPEFWLVILALGALAARIGLCLFLSGASRSKNAAGAALRVLIDLCVGLLAFWGVGLAILTDRWGALLGLHSAFGASALFDATMVLIATGVALGSTLERTRFEAPLVGSFLLAGLLVPLAGRWVWYGWLNHLGFVDMGGASVLYLTGGLCGAAGAILAGPRFGKYNHDGSANLIPGHSAPQLTCGAVALAFGMMWQIFGCVIIHGSIANSASDLSLAVVDPLLAAAAGGVIGLHHGRSRYGVFDLHFAVTGFLGGLVAASAGAGRLATPAAVFIGAVAGLLATHAAIRVDLRRKIDDPTAGIAIHVVSAIWGLLAAAALMTGVGSPAQRLRLVGVQTLGIAVIGAMTFAASLIGFQVFKKAVGLRPSEADELDGADLVEHDLNAYPDFHQTMVKSYHLRET